MEIVSIEAGTFKEMVAVWHSLKGKLEEVQPFIRFFFQINALYFFQFAF